MVVPHNPLSPVSTAACLQIAVSIPNFALLEYPRGMTSRRCRKNLAQQASKTAYGKKTW
ncbi:hypothetical protein [Pectobacterium sp. F1-1]|uniref:hypothetical protein n=1 Tax=Pectobacterium sp. F1-1 TaxID=2949614 RepID=UPI00398878D8